MDESKYEWKLGKLNRSSGVQCVLSSHTCQQKPVRLTDMDGKVGVLVMVPPVVLHGPLQSHVPKLDLYTNTGKDTSTNKVSNVCVLFQWL